MRAAVEPWIDPDVEVASARVVACRAGIGESRTVFCADDWLAARVRDVPAVRGARERKNNARSAATAEPPSREG
jgi:hypothetical protein